MTGKVKIQIFEEEKLVNEIEKENHLTNNVKKLCEELSKLNVYREFLGLSSEGRVQTSPPYFLEKLVLDNLTSSIGVYDNYQTESLDIKTTYGNDLAGKKNYSSCNRVIDNDLFDGSKQLIFNFGTAECVGNIRSICLHPDDSPYSNSVDNLNRINCLNLFMNRIPHNVFHEDNKQFYIYRNSSNQITKKRELINFGLIDSTGTLYDLGGGTPKSRPIFYKDYIICIEKPGFSNLVVNIKVLNSIDMSLVFSKELTLSYSVANYIPISILNDSVYINLSESQLFILNLDTLTDSTSIFTPIDELYGKYFIANLNESQIILNSSNYLPLWNSEFNIIDDLFNVFKRKTGPSPGANYVNFFSRFSNSYLFSINGEFGSYIYPNSYLPITVLNLDEPIEKTNTQTMTITYTLSW